MILSGTNTPGQSGPMSDDNEGVFRILQSPKTTGISPSDCLMSYTGHLSRVLTPLWYNLLPQPTEPKN